MHSPNAQRYNYQKGADGVAPVRQTRQETIDKYRGYQKVSANITDSVTGIYPSGDTHVTLEFISTGTTVDGRHWGKPICTVFTIENGLITSDDTYYDN